MIFPQLIAHLHNINITILPVIIIPVTGLCCLVFYNRIAALNSQIHTVEKDLRELFIKPPAISKQQQNQLIASLKDQQKKLFQRSNLIRFAIVSCFCGLLAFIFSAISIILGIFWDNSIIITLTLWVLGAGSFATGLLTGINEIRNPSLGNIMAQTALIEQWLDEVQENEQELQGR